MTLHQVYGKGFFRGQSAGSLKGAHLYASIVMDCLIVRSVVDVGCGSGQWLKAFEDLGVETLLGVDGDWVTAGQLASKKSAFVSLDLNKPLPSILGRYDLCVSVEVAEHLDPTSGYELVTGLTNLSDAVVFGAAYPGQGGSNHINERKQSFWCSEFIDRGFIPFDLFRPLTWGNSEVPFWYQQNTFLYVRKGSQAQVNLVEKGHMAITNPSFMDCVHPVLFDAKTYVLEDRRSLAIRLLQLAAPQWVRSVVRKLRRFSPLNLSNTSRKG